MPPKPKEKPKAPEKKSQPPPVTTVAPLPEFKPPVVAVEPQKRSTFPLGQRVKADYLKRKGEEK